MSLENENSARARIEAALYAAGRPLDLVELAKAAEITSERKALSIVREIQKDFKEKMVAIEIAEIAGGKFAMQLKTKYTKVARRFSLRPLVSNAVLKTLSYIIYLQPVTSKDLADRRGPQAYGHLKQLLELGFIHAERSGRTRIFRTTSTFSEYFGLSDDPDKIRRRLAAPQKRDAQKL
ncbi:MAG: SMC-Scp complex subunit ScpB [Thaumarchaeota archaeon]|nr:SMC-Scp complex subunit ScpB [Nitrososphaerota archaeon]MCL5316660.1 SMC-Scp complex subunit ScpB [Nitrososphaerota archaeon]